MALDVAGVFDSLASLAAATGRFDAVIKHEPKSAPDNPGLCCAMWVSDPYSAVQSSGMVSLSVRVEICMRIMKNMLSEPQDMIEIDVLAGADAIMNALAGGLTLGGTARAVDLLGMEGELLRAVPGYLSIGGGQQSGAGTRMFRVMDVFVPVIINDVWTLGE